MCACVYTYIYIYIFVGPCGPAAVCLQHHTDTQKSLLGISLFVLFV